MTSSAGPRLRVIIWLTLTLSAGVPALSATAIPTRGTASAPELAFTGFVVDQAAVLAPEEKARLTARLDRFQQETGHQFAVVTIDNLHGQDIGRFTMALANRWGVGRRAVNDGIVLLVAPNEKQARIAVGRGLEHRLTDPLCASIMQSTIIPAIRKNGVVAGIDAGVGAIIAQFGPNAR